MSIEIHPCWCTNCNHQTMPPCWLITVNNIASGTCDNCAVEVENLTTKPICATWCCDPCKWYGVYGYTSSCWDFNDCPKEDEAGHIQVTITVYLYEDRWYAELEWCNCTITFEKAISAPINCNDDHVLDFVSVDGDCDNCDWSSSTLTLYEEYSCIGCPGW